MDDSDALFAEFLGEIKAADVPTTVAEAGSAQEASTGEKRPAQADIEQEIAVPAPKKAKISSVAARAKPTLNSAASAAAAAAAPAAASASIGPATGPLLPPTVTLPPPAPAQPYTHSSSSSAAAAAAIGPNIGPYAGPPARPPPPPPPPVMTPFQQQQSAYQYVPAAAAGSEAAAGSKKAKKFIRVGGGSVWQDATLAEWPEDDFRLFVGDIGNEVSDAELAAAFAGYASFQRAKIVRDKFTSKSKGFGFVSFLDGFDMMKALREQQGKYLGNRPMKLSKSTWQDRNIQQVRKKERKNKKDKKALGLL